MVTVYRMHRGLTLDEMLRFCAWINASDGAYSVEFVVHQGWTALCSSVICGEEDADLSTPYAWAVALIDYRRGVSARFVDPRQVATFQHDGTYRRCPRYASDPVPYEPDPEGILYEFHWGEVWPLLRLRPRWPRGTALVDVVDGGRDDFYADVIAPVGLPPRRYCASCVCSGLDDPAYQVYICTRRRACGRSWRTRRRASGSSSILGAPVLRRYNVMKLQRHDVVRVRVWSSSSLALGVSSSLRTRPI